MSKCEHNRAKAMCRDCGSSQFCEHNRRKTICKECGGGSLCEHNKERTKCKECKGGSVCEHNRIKTSCKDCKGGSICEHNKVRGSCKECHGYCFCKHNKRKNLCKECGGSQLCEHNIQRRYCKPCGGSCICIHGINKYHCITCSPSQFCQHKKQIQICVECAGSSICKHNKTRSDCVECAERSICKHKKQRRRCKECGGEDLCKTPLCETRKHKKYNGYCLPCCVNTCPEIEVSRNYKTKERSVADKIKESFPEFDWVLDKRVEGGCSKRRPDLLLDLYSHVIIIEVDENKHDNYDCSCENKRLMELSKDLAHRPIVFIRFNPDGYIDKDGKKVSSCWRLNGLGVMTIMKTRQTEWDLRINTLKEQVEYWINNGTDKTVEIIELFY
jgi:hypothetical protein